jgi:hypothetical protein
MGTWIYKCLSWDSNQQQELGKPSQKKNSQSALRREQDSFAAVLPMPGYSSMYKVECDLMSRVNE